MRIRRLYIVPLLAGGMALSTVPLFANGDQDLSQYLERETTGESPNVWPGRDKVVPHVSGDRNFSNTYQYWKDEEAIAAAKADGRSTPEMNYRDFRGREKSFEAEMISDQGREIFHRRSSNGNSCASCHGDDAAELEGTYVKFPKFNERLDRVVGVPTQIGVCASERQGEDWVEDTKENSLLALYLASKSHGEPVAVDTDHPKVEESFERGADLFFRRTGHFGFACASCHTPPTAGENLRGQRPTTFYGDASAYPIYHFPYQLEGDDLEYIFTLQHQIRACQSLSRMKQGEEGSPAMTDIETFLRSSSNGYPFSAPVDYYELGAN